MKSLPGSRAELARGGSGTSRSVETHMSIATQIAEMQRQRQRLIDEQVMLNGQVCSVEHGGRMHIAIKKRLAVIRSQIASLNNKLSRLRERREEAAGIDRLFRDRARSMLSTDQYQMLLRMAKIDQSEILLHTAADEVDG